MIGGSFKTGGVEHFCSSIVQAVNVATDEYMRVADTLESTFQPALSALGDRIIACGGFLGPQMTRTCQIFNARENACVFLLHFLTKICYMNVLKPIP